MGCGWEKTSGDVATHVWMEFTAREERLGRLKEKQCEMATGSHYTCESPFSFLAVSAQLRQPQRPLAGCCLLDPMGSRRM